MCHLHKIRQIKTHTQVKNYVSVCVHAHTYIKKQDFWKDAEQIIKN